MKSEQHETNVALHSPKTWKAGTLVYSSAGLAMLFFWLLWGDFTWAMKDRAVGPSATLLIKQIGVSDFLYALIVIAFPNFTNIILGPVISYLSDRHRGPHGRRIPFLAFTTPFIVLGLYGLGLTPWLGGELHELFPALSLHGGRLVVFCVSWVLLDFGTTLAGALFNALVNDVVPRELLGRFYGLFRMISLGAGVLFNFFLLKEVELYVMPIFIGIGTLYGIGLLCLCLKVKEGSYPPPETEEGEVSQSKSSQAIKVWRAALTYLRLDSESTDYVFCEQSLDDIVKRSVRKFAAQFIGRGIRLDYTPSGKRVTTDGKWLGFVIEQLLSNALKYTQRGSVAILAEESPPTFSLVIRDTGIGIAPEDIPRVFERGYTGCNGRSGQSSSGLGLWLCKRVCGNLGCGVSISSEVGRGTAVRLTFDGSERRFE